MDSDLEILSIDECGDFD